MSIQIKTYFDKETGTFTYVVSDEATSKAAIIDSVLNYDQFAGKTSTTSADEVIAYIQENALKLEWILETHIHADHLTASHYIKEKIGGKIAIGSRITQVLNFWVPLLDTHDDTPMDASQFDKIFEDNESFTLGHVDIKVLHTPGHTPACACYLIEDAIFTGDTLFMPDIGTARTDFPGGSPEIQYNSIMRILDLPDTTRIFIGHDYPLAGREANAMTTVKEEKENNILINQAVSKETYIKTRSERDIGKPVPKLLFPAIQVNLRAGSLGKKEKGVHYIKIPVNSI